MSGLLGTSAAWGASLDRNAAVFGEFSGSQRRSRRTSHGRGDAEPG